MTTFARKAAAAVPLMNVHFSLFSGKSGQGKLPMAEGFVFVSLNSLVLSFVQMDFV